MPEVTAVTPLSISFFIHIRFDVWKCECNPGTKRGQWLHDFEITNNFLSREEQNFIFYKMAYRYCFIPLHDSYKIIEIAMCISDLTKIYNLNIWLHKFKPLYFFQLHYTHCSNNITSLIFVLNVSRELKLKYPLQGWTPHPWV